MYPRILDPQPSITEQITNRKYWKPKILHFRGRKIVYDKDIRTGECLLCKRNGRPQYSGPTYLHHLKYDDTEPLAWTIEVCGKCHYQIDDYNKKILRRRFAPRDFAKAVDREAEIIALNNMSHEERMRKYVRGYTEFK